MMMDLKMVAIFSLLKKTNKKVFIEVWATKNFIKDKITGRVELFSGPLLRFLQKVNIDVTGPKKAQSLMSFWVIYKKKIPFIFNFIAGGPAYYVLHPQKGITICLFLTYQAFRNREWIISRKIIIEGLQI